MIESSATVGNATAQEQVATTQFFTDISQRIGIGVELVRGAGYGLLSLLLEVSALGMISLVRAFRSDLANARNSAGDDEASSPPSDSPEYQNEEARQAAARLTEDILKGRIPPVLRRIRAARYGLDIDAIRRILKDLYDAGVLEADKRRSYKLSESAQNPFQETAQSEERNKKFGERSTGDWRAIRGRFRRLL